MLEFLFAHQLQPQFRCTNVWTENDLLIWDHLGTLHRAIADYGPDEIRLIRRCQVMATKVFDPDFLRPARELAAAAGGVGPEANRWKRDIWVSAIWVSRWRTSCWMAGMSLTVYDINEAAMQPLLERQARRAASPKDLADRCEIVFVSLPTLAAFRAVAFGAEGLASGQGDEGAGEYLHRRCAVREGNRAGDGGSGRNSR